MRTNLYKHALGAAAATAAVLLVTGSIASAHVDPDPLAMEAGTTGTVAFTITHGCDGSPTNSLKFEIPEGVTGVAPVEKEGWTARRTGAGGRRRLGRRPGQPNVGAAPSDRCRSARGVRADAGLSYDEAAVVLDCPVGTIRSRVARARADLAEEVRAAEAS